MKWKLFQADGALVTTTGSFVGIQTQEVACDGGTPVGQPVQATSRSGFKPLGGGRWQYNVQTLRQWPEAAER